MLYLKKLIFLKMVGIFKKITKNLQETLWLAVNLQKLMFLLISVFIVIIVKVALLKTTEKLHYALIQEQQNKLLE